MNTSTIPYTETPFRARTGGRSQGLAWGRRLDAALVADRLANRDLPRQEGRSHTTDRRRRAVQPSGRDAVAASTNRRHAARIELRHAGAVERAL
jgi:hypothetical protein